MSADPNVADTTSAQIVLSVAQPFANHNGGQLAFGPDGFLYIGLGDGGDAGDPGNRAQNLGTLLGKILRIDVDGAATYTIPTTNPFRATPNALPEIWAYGLRNPWRFSFDRLTGDLFIADVGQGAREEVNFQPAASAGGQNYGWRRMEGTACFNPSTACNDGTLTLPILEYDHSLGCSITGGYRYRGARFPQFVGRYFYGDFCSGRIWTGIQSGAAWTGPQLLDTTMQITSFGEDEDGELYVVHYGSGSNGTLQRVVDTNQVFPLTVSRAGAGTGTVSGPAGINCGSVCSATFGAGAVVTLTATPAAGSVFAGWSGGGCSGTGSCVVTVTAATTVTATFSVPTFTLTITRTGTGSGTIISAPAGIGCPVTCSAPFTPGTSVTLTAQADPGSIFSGWSGGGCSGTGSCVVTLNVATTVTATFTFQGFVLTVTTQGPGTVVSTAGGNRLRPERDVSGGVLNGHGRRADRDGGRRRDVLRVERRVRRNDRLHGDDVGRPRGDGDLHDDVRGNVHRRSARGQRHPAEGRARDRAQAGDRPRAHPALAGGLCVDRSGPHAGIDPLPADPRVGDADGARAGLPGGGAHAADLHRRGDRGEPDDRAGRAHRGAPRRGARAPAVRPAARAAAGAGRFPGARIR